MEQNRQGRTLTEQQAIRTFQATERYGGKMGESLINFVSDPNEVTKRNFAELIATSLESESSTLKTDALMALMSAFELMLEDRVNSVMDETRQSRFDSIRIK